jgi:hypothetical protein
MPTYSFLLLSLSCLIEAGRQGFYNGAAVSGEGDFQIPQQHKVLLLCSILLQTEKFNNVIQLTPKNYSSIKNKLWVKIVFLQ